MLFTVLFSPFIPFVEPIHSILRLKSSFFAEYSLGEFIRSFNSAAWYCLAGLSIRYLSKDLRKLFESKNIIFLVLLFYLAGFLSSLVHCLTLKFIDAQSIMLCKAAIEYSFGDLTAVTMFCPLLFVFLTWRLEPERFSKFFQNGIKNFLFYLFLISALIFFILQSFIGSSYLISLLYIIIVPICFLAVKEEILGTSILLLVLLFPFLLTMQKLLSFEESVLVQPIMISVYITAILLAAEARTRRLAQEEALKANSFNLKKKNDYAYALEREVKNRTKELKMANATLKELASIDDLTGVYNRRELFRKLDQELERAKRYGSSLCLAIVDFDHFKRINDLHGHYLGDLVLKEVCLSWSNCLRNSDILGRYGGEEFVFIFPETDLDALESILSKIQEAINLVELEGSEHHRLRVTVSIGAAMLDNYFEDRDRLLVRADKALFQAKQSGRNCYVISRSSSSEVSANEQIK